MPITKDLPQNPETEQKRNRFLRGWRRAALTGPYEEYANMRAGHQRTYRSAEAYQRQQALEAELKPLNKKLTALEEDLKKLGGEGAESVAAEQKKIEINAQKKRIAALDAQLEIIQKSNEFVGQEMSTAGKAWHGTKVAGSAAMMGIKTALGAATGGLLPGLGKGIGAGIDWATGTTDADRYKQNSHIQEVHARREAIGLLSGQFVALMTPTAKPDPLADGAVKEEYRQAEEFRAQMYEHLRSQLDIFPSVVGPDGRPMNPAESYVQKMDSLYHADNPEETPAMNKLLEGIRDTDSGMLNAAKFQVRYTKHLQALQNQIKDGSLIDPRAAALQLHKLRFEATERLKAINAEQVETLQATSDKIHDAAIAIASGQPFPPGYSPEEISAAHELAQKAGAPQAVTDADIDNFFEHKVRVGVWTEEQAAEYKKAAMLKRHNKGTEFGMLDESIRREARSILTEQIQAFKKVSPADPKLMLDHLAKEQATALLPANAKPEDVETKAKEIKKAIEFKEANNGTEFGKLDTNIRAAARVIITEMAERTAQAQETATVEGGEPSAKREDDVALEVSGAKPTAEHKDDVALEVSGTTADDSGPSATLESSTKREPVSVEERLQSMKAAEHARIAKKGAASLATAEKQMSSMAEDYFENMAKTIRANSLLSRLSRQQRLAAQAAIQKEMEQDESIATLSTQSEKEQEMMRRLKKVDSVAILDKVIEQQGYIQGGDGNAVWQIDYKDGQYSLKLSGNEQFQQESINHQAALISTKSDTIKFKAASTKLTEDGRRVVNEEKTGRIALKQAIAIMSTSGLDPEKSTIEICTGVNEKGEKQYGQTLTARQVFQKYAHLMTPSQRLGASQNPQPGEPTAYDMYKQRRELSDDNVRKILAGKDSADMEKTPVSNATAAQFQRSKDALKRDVGERLADTKVEKREIDEALEASQTSPPSASGGR